MNKQPTLAVVKYAALFLIEVEGSTTTLAVKSLLRDYDYEANQSDISQLMNQAAEQLPLAYDVGVYRVYKMPTPADTIANTTTNTVVDTFNAAKSSLPAQRSMVHKVTYTQKNGDQLILSKINDRNIFTGDVWRISSTHYDGVLYHEYETSRDAVRQAYAAIYKVPFHSVRACKH